MTNEDAFIDWLIQVLHYPFDMGFDPPPPVDSIKLALRWKELDGWSGVSDEDAIDMIRSEMGLEED